MARQAPEHPHAASLRAQVRRERKARTIHEKAVRERNRLLLAALAAGMTQSAAAELIGVTKTRVEQIARAERERLAREAEAAKRLEGVFDEVAIYFANDRNAR